MNGFKKEDLTGGAGKKGEIRREKIWKVMVLVSFGTL